MWAGGTVALVGDTTVFIDNGQYSNETIPVVFTNNSAPFYCQPTNDSDVRCAGKADVSNVQDKTQGEEVCAFIGVENGVIEAGKVFFDAVCGGPQAPPQ